MNRQNDDDVHTVRDSDLWGGFNLSDCMLHTGVKNASSECFIPRRVRANIPRMLRRSIRSNVHSLSFLVSIDARTQWRRVSCYCASNGAW